MTLVQRVLILVGVMLALVAGVGAYEVALFRNANEAAAGRELSQTLAVATAEYGRFVDRVREAALAATVEAPRAIADPNACSALMSALPMNGALWLRFDVLDTHGIVRCSSTPEDVGANKSGYPEVIAARTRGVPVADDYTWGLFSGTPGLTVAAAWHGPNGTSGTVTGLARLDPLVQSLRALLPQDYAAIVADRGGHILASVPPAGEEIGKALPPSLASRALLDAPGQALLGWNDGSKRRVAYAPIALPGQPPVFIAVGIDRAAVSSPARALGLRVGLALSLATLGAFALSWWGGIYYIRRPLGKLAEVALKWRDGDQTARVRLPGRSEIAALGRVFNAMADAKDQSDLRTRESADLLAALIESSRDCIFVIDPGGSLLLANSTCLEIIGLTREVALGHKLIVHRDRTMQRAMDTLQERVVGTRTLQAADLTIQALDNRRRRVLQTICAPIFGSGGQVRAIAGIGRDVTEARETAEMLRQARDEAEAADHAKTRFLAAASHDLRQPLQAAILLAELVHSAGSGTPTSNPADALRRTLDDMKRLLDSLFDVSRLDSGTMTPDVTAFPLQSLLEQIIIPYRRLAESKRISLLAMPTEATVRSDRVLLGRMLNNLLENAVRYTQFGHVLIECEPVEQRLLIRIEDTGVGIVKQDLSRIWHEFEQLQNPGRDRRQGLGLGLSIVRRLASLLDHPIEVSSEPGKGSSFVVSVPLESGNVPSALPTPGRPAEHSSKAGRLVVVVDDDPLLLEGLRLTLEEYAWDVIAAIDCASAIQSLPSAGQRPDLIIADYRLRDGEVGSEAIRVIRERVGHRVPAIILTGELTSLGCEVDQPMEDARRLGAAIYRKPIRSTELLDAMRSAIAATASS